MAFHIKRNFKTKTKRGAKISAEKQEKWYMIQATHVKPPE
jgi:hypothetical protein